VGFFFAATCAARGFLRGAGFFAPAFFSTVIRP
jgi:hypothetical protein